MDDCNYIPGYSYDPVSKKHFRLVDNVTLLPKPLPFKNRARYNNISKKKKLLKKFKDSKNAHNSLIESESATHPRRGLDHANNLCWWTAMRQMDSTKNNPFQTFIKRKALISPSLQEEKISIVRHCVGYQLRSHFCQFLLTDNDSEHIVGIWKNENGLSQWIHTLSVDSSLDHAQRKDIWKNDFIPLSVNYHRLEVTGEITAMCWAESQQRNSVLVCTTEQPPWNSFSFLYNLDSPRHSHDGVPKYKPQLKTNLDKDAIFSCAFSKVQDRFHSMAFNDDGQLLYSGSGKGALYTTDLRMSPSKQFAASCYPSQSLICSLHLLQNQRQIIASGFQNSLSLLDLRMLKVPAIKYLEHHNEHRKIPITVNEELGVVCSAGQDKITRVWDIGNSSPIRTFEPPSTCLSEIYIPVATFQVIKTGEIFVGPIFLAFTSKISMSMNFRVYMNLSV